MANEAKKACGYIRRVPLCRNCAHVEIYDLAPAGGKRHYHCAMHNFTTTAAATCRNHDFKERTQPI